MLLRATGILMFGIKLTIDTAIQGRNRKHTRWGKIF